ncbi:hypothetical protein Sm713_03750 [Streptomyces sp. TS71-3]|nr:hypothetical protein Sm713_03750 [Streptomyces sp. TS71-3]
MRTVAVRGTPVSVRAVRGDRARYPTLDTQGLNGEATDMRDSDKALDDDEAAAVIKFVSRQLKLWRQSAGLTQPEFGAAIGYGEELVSSVERGKRIPRPEYLDAADEALGAGGKISAMKKDVEEARYPKKVRDLKNLEEEAVELCAYNNTIIQGLLQTEEYIRASAAIHRGRA